MKILPDRRNAACLIVLLSLMCFGCGRDEPTSTDPQETDAQEQVPSFSTRVDEIGSKPIRADSQFPSIPADSVRIAEAQDRRFLVHSVKDSKEQSDWPRFRGPQGTGRSTDTGLPLKWSGTQNIAWKTPMPGPGSSSPIVFGNHVYVTCYSGYGQSHESPGEPGNLKRHLVCLDRNDGHVLWTATLPNNAEVTPFKDPIAIGKHGYASSTPVADASGVYVYFGSSGAAAYTHKGELQWHVSCGKQTHTYGSASSPILYVDLLIIHAEVENNSLIALDKATGRQRWRRPTPEGGGNGDTWNTPNIFDVAGRPELVFVSGYGKVAAADPRNGAELWEIDAQILRINPSIVRRDGLYFALGGPNGKSVGLQVDRTGNRSSVKIQWELNKSAYVTSPVYHEGHLYWAHDWGGIAYCVNARTGKLIYQKRLEQISGDIYASPVVADGRIYYVSSSTGTVVLPARPKYEVLAHNVIETDDSPFHGSPAISGGQIFLRSNKFVYCIGKKSQTKADVSSQESFDNRPESASRSESGEEIFQTSLPASAGNQTKAPSSRDTTVDNWPGFRGKGGSGVSDEAGLPTEWSANQNIHWKRELPGPGSSSPITWGNHVYVTCYSGYGLNAETPGDKSKLKRHLVCINGDDGRLLWDKTLPASGHEKPYRDTAMQFHGYASPTPAADESGVYVFYGPSGAAAYSHAGDLRWRASCGESSHAWGTSPSVVLHDGLVILNAANESDSLIALDKQTGREVWRTPGLASAFHTPLLARAENNGELIVAHNEGHLVGLDPNNGRHLWTCRAFVAHINSAPIAHQGVVYVTGLGKCAAVRGGGRGTATETHKLWELDKGSYVSSPVYHGGHVYWAKEDGGIVYCANAKTGELVYQERLDPPSGRIYASPSAADGKLYYVSRENGTYVVSAEPRFRLLAHNTIENDESVFNGSPAIRGDKLLLRSNRFLYCIGR